MERALFDKIVMLAAAALALSGCTIAAATSQASAKVEDAQHSDAMVRFGKVCEDIDDWDKPTEPFHIHGDTGMSALAGLPRC